MESSEFSVEQSHVDFFHFFDDTRELLRNQSVLLVESMFTSFLHKLAKLCKDIHAEVKVIDRVVLNQGVLG